MVGDKIHQSPYTSSYPLNRVSIYCPEFGEQHSSIAAMAASASSAQIKLERVDLTVHGVEIDLAVARRISASTAPPMVLLHGFGSTKEDFVDLIFYPPFGDRTLIAYDAPGCGETTCSDLSILSIEFLVATLFALYLERESCLPRKSDIRLHVSGAFEYIGKWPLCSISANSTPCEDSRGRYDSALYSSP